ncbi:Gti1/Pac2 family-domain-containing protein [Aspergillus novoparasiticus]|uniref:Gti1/Pac2 family-domain-containing protein n=1 Tax=Aspergillus novoparasiticus TaxID=986946 RepID=A0A5N6E9A8_9EURO|nr:Gti1/Pac2 family-domain-containing protein [Aspergillus novoparasiticus]
MKKELEEDILNKGDRAILPGQMETYYGNILSTKDVIVLFEACRIGYLPSVKRRLSEKERSQIRPGSVFVWAQQEAGMQRWTDGKSWSASRVSGRILTYYEIKRNRVGPEPQQNEVGDSACTAANGRYKTSGLIKRTLSILTTTGQSVHLVWYLSNSQDEATNFLRPSTDPTLRFHGTREEESTSEFGFPFKYGACYTDTTIFHAGHMVAVYANQKANSFTSTSILPTEVSLFNYLSVPTIPSPISGFLHP